MAHDETKRARGSIWHGPGQFERPEEAHEPDLERDPTILAGRARVPLTGSVSGGAGSRAGKVVATEPEPREDVAVGDGPDEAGTPRQTGRAVKPHAKGK